ncbi:MAG: nitroreductase [FCB group bacterium]|nr:nitroreductase [FCB group bacterium]
MSGIVFFRTQQLQAIIDFYTTKIGCQVWIDQNDCVILQNGNLRFGFCDREEADTEGMITFFYESMEEVDKMFAELSSIAVAPPATNDKYNIYQFFARDPEGRNLEFQYFQTPTAAYLSGDDLLLTRRSIRQFAQAEISDAVVDNLLELCRFAPTSCNTQSYYFKIIRDRSLIEKLAQVRGSNSAPIGRAPLAVAIVADPQLTKRPDQDGCIAAYHFLLAARFYGLGTCWIAAMDVGEVKDILGIPKDHYVATVTPLGYPADLPVNAPERKERSWFVRE